MSKRMSRRRFLKRAGASALYLAASPMRRIEAAPSFDLILKGGTILDGTGGPPWMADLGIAGDTIATFGTIAPEQGKRVLNIEGLDVCPGFIDIHSHSDGDILVYPSDDSRVRQGVTTEVTGNCGSSAAPLRGVGAERRRRVMLEQDGLEADWTDVASYCARVEKTGVSVNQALLLGQGTLRASAIGLEDRPLNKDELQNVLQAAEEGMDQGAFGLSTGLEYTPGRYTPTEEIVEMARLVARRGGLYASHIRNEDISLLEAVNEAIEIGRRAGVRVEVSHLKAGGRPYWPKQRPALDLIESARRSGIEVMADAYPYTAWSTSLTIFLESWSLEGGVTATIRRLQDPADRARIRKDVNARVFRAPGNYDLVVISRVRTEKNRSLVGKNLTEIGSIWNVDAVDATLRLIEQEEGAVGFVGHGMSPENVEMVLVHPLVMIGSDGSSMAPLGRAAQTRPHPRSYGAYARVLSYYVRDRKLFDLPTAVKKMTSMPANQLGITDRGRIARGSKADLVVFDPRTVKDEATFDNPHRYPTGILHVLVNGVPVVDQSRHTGARPGRMLRKT